MCANSVESVLSKTISTPAPSVSESTVDGAMPTVPGASNACEVCGDEAEEQGLLE